MNDIEISTIAKMIKIRLPFIIIVTVLIMGCIGYISFHWIKPVYEATSSLIIQLDNKGTNLQLDNVMANQNMIGTYAEILTSHRIINHAISRNDWNISYEKFVKKVKIKTEDRSLVTNITVVDGDPALAAQMSNELAVSFLSQVNSILMTQNISILDEALIPDRPTRPNHYINIAIAGVLGLVLSVGLALMMELMFKKVRYEDELQHLLNAPVLVAVSRFTRKTINNRGNQTKVAKKFENQNQGKYTILS